LVSTTEIKKPIILLVEGKDEEIFFRYYQKFLRDTGGDEWINIDNLQIICYEGISQLGKTLMTIPEITGSELIRKIGIIRDAEDSADTAFAETKKALRGASLDSPRNQLSPTTGNPIINVMIIPENGDGSIEINFLESVKNDPAYTCVIRYIECLTPLYDGGILSKPKNIHKTKLHAFLSSRKEPNISIGAAAQNGYWDYNNGGFDRIKIFLSQLIT
jgi:hypothetical protein